MEINEFIINLQNKYHYSEELVNFLRKALPALISYYGEDKKDLIFKALYNCEIHIQEEGEVSEEYLNNYFGINKKWDIPFSAGAFQDVELAIKDNVVQGKNIIYLKTKYIDYRPFDFNDDSKLSELIHEMCHAIKGYGKLKLENGEVVTSTGLSKDYYVYDPESNTMQNNKSINVGLEEALNSYDEAQVMTLMTGIVHEHGAYEGMSLAMSKLMSHEELAKAIRTSQFSGGDEWISFLGKEDSTFLAQNFEDWVSVLYSSPDEILNNGKDLMAKMDQAMDNLGTFIKNYSTIKEVQDFQNSKEKADQKTNEIINQIIYYNKMTNSFTEEKRGKK